MKASDMLRGWADVPPECEQTVSVSVAVVRAVADLIDASTTAHEILDGIIENLGPCDHDVGICLCQDIRDADALRAALAALERAITGESDASK